MFEFSSRKTLFQLQLTSDNHRQKELGRYGNDFPVQGRFFEDSLAKIRLDHENLHFEISCALVPRAEVSQENEYAKHWRLIFAIQIKIFPGFHE